MNSTQLEQQTPQISRFNHDTIKKLDEFIMVMPLDIWYKIGEDETKLAVIKDWIDKDLLQPDYLTLSEDHQSFIKRTTKILTMTTKMAKSKPSGNTYRMSNGERISKKEINRRVTAAKKVKRQQIIDEFDHLVCEECFRNDCEPVDISHNLSVDWCQKNGCAELAWDTDNMKGRGRKCHQIKDKLDLRFTSNKPQISTIK
jgi:hypothetical protein